MKTVGYEFEGGSVSQRTMYYFATNYVLFRYELCIISLRSMQYFATKYVLFRLKLWMKMVFGTADLCILQCLSNLFHRGHYTKFIHRFLFLQIR
jgi:hypothetical protein